MYRASIGWAGLAAFAAATAGCGAIVGFDQDYQEGTAGAGGSGITASASSVMGPTAGAGGAGAVTGGGGAGGVASGGGSTGEGGATAGSGGFFNAPSCKGLSLECGPEHKEDCCTSKAIPGGTFLRENDPAHQAKVSIFFLDRFEVTVGRFRKFVEAFPGSKPGDGAGQAKYVMGDTRWQMAWDANLPTSKEDLAARLQEECTGTSTWTPDHGPDDQKPMNCINWFEALAFCIWDGGRLPTELEWNFVASGGDKQLKYPWGADKPDPIRVNSCEVYANNACLQSHLSPVGAHSPQGDGYEWRNADLAGSLWEWALDNWSEDHQPSCENCVNLSNGPDRSIRGGSWQSDVDTKMFSYTRSYAGALTRSQEVGVRCARDLP